MAVIGRWDAVGVLCVAAFATALGLQRSDIPLTPNALTGGEVGEVRLGHEWMGLHHEGRRVGVMHLEKRATVDGFHFNFETEMRLQAMGRETSMRVEVGADLDQALALRGFEFSVVAGPADFRGSGVVDGRNVALTIKTGGASTTQSLVLPEPPILRANMAPILSRGTLVPGSTTRFHVFDPVTQQNQVVDVEIIGADEVLVMGEVVPVTHVRQSMNGLKLDGWMNAQGEMLRQELGLGLVAIRETEEQARWGLRTAGPAPDLMQSTMIKAPGLPARLTRAAGLKLRLSEPGHAAVRALEPDARQWVEGDWLIIQREFVGLGRPLVKVDAATEIPAEFLAATTWVQSDHPAIRDAARAAIGDAVDTLTATRRIVRWLNQTMTQQAVPGVPSALETLRSKVGDCNEHATLFTALARSVGVPARIVVGIVYRDGQFGYHAWNEVMIAEGWITVDPTWDQLPADPGHVRLIRGGLREQVALLKLIGALQVREATVF